MYKAAAAMKSFFSGFGLEAYQVSTVPDDVQTPYITYSLSVPEWNQMATGYAQVWDRTTSNEGIIRKADQITRAIGESLTLPFDGGYLVIRPESPLIQIMVDGDYRSSYIDYSINSYYLPGE